MIRVVKGNPTPEELAAAVAVVQARAAATALADDEPTDQPPEWHDPARTVPRAPRAPGPHAWRTSFWPA